MPETGPKEIDNSEIVQEQKKDNRQKDITIEETLQESLPNDESKQKLFLEIFNQPIFSNLPPQNTNNELSQADIIEYIKSWRLIGNSRSISRMNSLEEKIKFTIEDIDDYFKSTTWSVKEIKTYTNILNETNEVLTTNDEVLTTNNETIESADTLLESRKATKESYDNLNKTKYPEPTAEEINKQKEKITPQTQELLTAKWLSTEEYTKFLIFEETYETDLRKEGNTEFLDNLKELKEDLGDETTLKNTL